MGAGHVSQPALVTFADTPDTLVFKKEKASGFEVGYKGMMLDNRLRVELTAYIYKFKGLQLTSFDTASSSYRFYNAADAKQRGIEGSVNFKASDAITLRGAFNYNRLKYGSYPNAACWNGQATIGTGCVNGLQDLTGRQLPRAPKFVATLGFTFEQPVGNDLVVTLDGDYKYTGSQFLHETLEPLSHFGSYSLVNGSLRLSSEKTKWEIAVVGRNLTNKRTIEFAADKPGGGFEQMMVWTGRPRQIALEGTFRF